MRPNRAWHRPDVSRAIVVSPHAAPRLRRTIAALTAVTGALLAWATVPAASAAIITIPDPGGAYGPVPATSPTAPAQVIAVGGMPGWQITLIAAGAAALAAVLALLLARAWAARRHALAPSA